MSSRSGAALELTVQKEPEVMTANARTHRRTETPATPGTVAVHFIVLRTAFDNPRIPALRVGRFRYDYKVL